MNPKTAASGSSVAKTENPQVQSCPAELSVVTEMSRGCPTGWPPASAEMWLV